jgi:hypothetical protein
MFPIWIALAIGRPFQHCHKVCEERFLFQALPMTLLAWAMRQASLEKLPPVKEVRRLSTSEKIQLIGSQQAVIDAFRRRAERQVQRLESRLMDTEDELLALPTRLPPAPAPPPRAPNYQPILESIARLEKMVDLIDRPKWK